MKASKPNSLALTPLACLMLLQSACTLELIGGSGADGAESSGSLSIDCSQTANSHTASGDGTLGTPYLLSSANQIYCLSETATVADWGMVYQLTTDIDLSSFTSNSLAPIASSSSPFTGRFDGNGFRLSNWTYSDTAQDDVGLFAVLGTGSQVLNLTLEGFNVSGKQRAGSLAGSSEATLTDIQASGDILGEGQVGGLIGLQDGGSITNAHFSGNVEGMVSGSFNSTGGLVGQVGVLGGGSISLSSTAKVL